MADTWFESRLGEVHDTPDFIAEEVMLDIIEQVVKVMDERGITRAELAQRMGVSRAYVTRVLNGSPNLTVRSIAAIAVALGVRPQVRLGNDTGAAAARQALAG